MSMSSNRSVDHPITWRSWPLVLVLLLVPALAAWTHGPVLRAQALLVDDNEYLTQNELVQNPSWSNAWRFLSEVLTPSTVHGYYQPLAMISLMLDVAMGGTPEDLTAFHRTSLTLHVVNSVLLIVLLTLLFNRPWAAGAAVLLFAVHPMTVETIGWVGDRKTLLSSFFAFSSLIAYVQYTRRHSRAWYAAGLLLFGLGMMAKPTITPLPLLLVLLDLWPLNRLSRRTLIENAPWFALAAIFALITFVSQKRTAGVQMPTEYPPYLVPMVICHNLVHYLRTMVWPRDISPFYPLPTPISPLHWPFLIGIVGTVAMIGVMIVSLRRTRAVAVGGLYFFVAILPTLQIIGFTNAVAADKYVYFPAVGILMVIAWGLGQAWDRPAPRSDAVKNAHAESQSSQRGGGGVPVCSAVSAPLREIFLGLVILVIAAAEARATRHYLNHWKDTVTICLYQMKLAPRDPGLPHSLGLEMLRVNRDQAAVDYFQKAVKLRPNFPEAHHNLGSALSRVGRHDEAVGEYLTAIRQSPKLAMAYANLGPLLLDAGRTEDAVVALREAARLKPSDASILNNLGLALMESKRLPEAIEVFKAALACDARPCPERVFAWLNLGNAYTAMNQNAEALRAYREAVELDPTSVAAHFILGGALIDQGNLDGGLRHFREVVRLEPGNADAMTNIGMILAQQGKSEEAVREYRAALAINPRQATTHYNLGMALEGLNRNSEARLAYEAAHRLRPDDADISASLGKLAQRMGDLVEAMELFRQALTIDPQHKAARDGLESLDDRDSVP